MKEKIKEARAKTGLSQEDFAKEIDFSYSQYNKAESGQVDVSAKLIRKICNRYGISEDYFFGNSPLQITKLEKAIKNDSGNPYRDALIQRLEKELEDWKTMALRLSQSLSMGKLNTLTKAASGKQSGVVRAAA